MKLRSELLHVTVIYTAQRAQFYFGFTRHSLITILPDIQEAVNILLRDSSILSPPVSDRNTRTMVSFRQPTSLIVLVTCVSVVYPLNGPNVCTKLSLAPSSSVHSTSNLEQICEELGFTAVACQAAREGRINFSDLYLTISTDSCCDGWAGEGDMCSPCSPGWYGRNCSLPCQCLNTGICHHVTGECSCTEGWSGRHCEERCSTATYSHNCSLPCLAVCQNDGVCHPSNGHCLCDYRWEGEACSMSCQGLNCYMESDSCSNGATYDPTGYCLCAPGWQGRYCTEPCPANKHGPFCEGVCQCVNDGLCNWTDGSCLCRPGYTGTFCEVPCEEGTYGLDCNLRCDCPIDGGCDPVSGDCLTCPVGYTGPRCSDSCPPNFWGPSCNHQCNCPDQSMCDPYTGECPGQSAAAETTTPGVHTTDPMSTPMISKSYAVPSDKGSPPMSSFLVPLLVCLLLVSVISLLVVVALKYRCRKKSSDRVEGVVKLTHQYAECSGGKEESEYAEIVDMNGGYEVPMLDELDKPCTSSSSPTKRKQKCEVNYYKTPPARAPSGGGTSPGPMTTTKADNDGYLHLSGSQSPPPEYQTIITKSKWNLD